MADEGPFGKEAHDTQAPTHSGEGGHYCFAWDDLYICRDCPEYHVCCCDDPEHARWYRVKPWYNEEEVFGPFTMFSDEDEP